MRLDVPFKSAPAQKARPVPVTTPTCSDGSSSSHFQTASSSTWPSMLMQLRDFGRLSVTRSIDGVGKERRAYLQLGGWVVNEGDIVLIIKKISGRYRKMTAIGDREACRDPIVIFVMPRKDSISGDSAGSSSEPRHLRIWGSDGLRLLKKAYAPINNSAVISAPYNRNEGYFF